MGSRANPLAFRSELHGFWKSKGYSDSLTSLTKNLIFYKVLKTYFRRYNTSVISLKYLKQGLKEEILSIFVYKNYRTYRIRRSNRNLFKKILDTYEDCWFELDFMTHNPYYHLNSFFKIYLSGDTSYYLHDHNLADGPDDFLRYGILNKNYKFLFNILTNTSGNSGTIDVLFKTIFSSITLFFKNVKTNNNTVIGKFKTKKEDYIKDYNYNLRFKVISMELEYVFYHFFKNNLVINTVNINSFFSFSKYNKIPPYSNIVLSSGLFYYKDLVRSFFFSMYLKNSSVMCYAIGRHITNYKKHWFYVRSAKRLLNYILFYEKTKEFLGLRLKVCGKFQGKLRKKKYKFYHRYIALNAIKVYVDYSLHKVFTKFGVFSVKIWLFYKN